jgi:hypothetical protein
MCKNTNFSANDEKNIPINMLQGSEITKKIKTIRRRNNTKVPTQFTRQCPGGKS